MEPIEESVTYASELIKSVLDGEKLDPTYDGNASDVHSVTKSAASSSSTSSSTTTNNNNQTTTNNSNNEGLKASVGRSTVTLTEGDTFVYYGYSATYNGADVTNKTTATFSINGSTFTTYQKLISYVDTLSAGEYNIVYRISYEGEVKNLNQTVVIKENYNNTDSSSSNNGNNQNNNSDDNEKEEDDSGKISESGDGNQGLVP